MDEPDIERVLRYLAERLAFAGAPPTALLVCGGAALIALHLGSRATRDIDVIALIRRTEQMERASLQKAKPLPLYLVEASEQVARDLGLPADWLNPGPADLMDLGLPAGCFERSTRKEFGPGLHVHFVSRYDQIHFKLYAAVDQGGGRHLQDLRALNPTAVEILAAARWARTHDPSPGFRELLASMLTQLGYDEQANQI